jgi:hypothetical protein
MRMKKPSLQRLARLLGVRLINDPPPPIRSRPYSPMTPMSMRPTRADRAGRNRRR